MKRPLLIAAALASISCIASAQSTVSVFGGVDLAVRRIQNGPLGSANSLTSGSNSSSRLGFRGSEDLGNGLSAQFWLETDIAADTGRGGSASGDSFWNRRSILSLVSASVGELRIGRDYIPTHASACALDPFGCVGLAQNTVGRVAGSAVVSSGLGSVNPLVRGNNSIQLITPSGLGGFYGSIWISAAEGTTAGATENSKAAGGRVAYISGPWNAQAALYTIKNTPGAGSPEFKDVFFGASYDFGPAKLALSRRSFKYLGENASLNVVALSGPVSNAGTYKVQVTSLDQGGSVASNDAAMWSLGYVHDLSKRTAFYGTAMRVANKGSGVFTAGGPGPAVSAQTFGGKSSTGYELGIRHVF